MGASRESPEVQAVRKITEGAMALVDLGHHAASAHIHFALGKVVAMIPMEGGGEYFAWVQDLEKEAVADLENKRAKLARLKKEHGG